MAGSMEAVRALAYKHEGYYECEYCGKWDAIVHVHHIKSRGSGGRNNPDNLIALCWKCHTLAHNGRIKKEKLQQIAEGRECTQK